MNAKGNPSFVQHDGYAHHMRWMIRRDMPEVLDIEEESFEFPWSEENFIRCLRNRSCIGMVCERSIDGDKGDETGSRRGYYEDYIAGFMVYELHKRRINLLDFAVGGEYRRQQVGTDMIGKLKRKIGPQRNENIMLNVRETNLAAQLFFREQGFRAVSVFRNFYKETSEDAYSMEYRLSRVVVPSIPKGGFYDALGGDAEMWKPE